MICHPNPQNAHKLCFLPISMTFISDIKFHTIIFEPHHVKLVLLT